MQHDKKLSVEERLIVGEGIQVIMNVKSGYHRIIPITVGKQDPWYLPFVFCFGKNISPADWKILFIDVFC